MPFQFPGNAACLSCLYWYLVLDQRLPSISTYLSIRYDLMIFKDLNKRATRCSVSCFSIQVNLITFLKLVFAVTFYIGFCLEFCSNNCWIDYTIPSDSLWHQRLPSCRRQYGRISICQKHCDGFGIDMYSLLLQQNILLNV